MQEGFSSDRDLVNILLVDDRHENLVALSATLNNPDYHIVTANSGRQALSSLLRNEFAVVVLDVMMPEMDGYQVATLMKERERTQHVPIIFLTAVATDAGHIYKGYSSGAVDYLLKPVEPEIVKAKVGVFVDLFRSKQRIRQQAEVLRDVERQVQEAKLALFQRETEAWYSTTLNSIGDGVIATDTHGTIRYINPIAEQLSGWSLQEAHGKPIQQVFRILNEETRNEIENLTAKVIRDNVGSTLPSHTIMLNKSGKEFLIDDSGSPIRNEQGNILGAVIVFRDETEKRREADRKNLISKASRILLSSLDYNTNLNGVCRLAVCSFADYCVFDLISEENKLEQVAFAHCNPAKEEKIKKMPFSLPPSIANSDSTEVMNTLTPTETFPFKSCIRVPLSLHDHKLGFLTVLSEANRPEFSSADAQMLEELASRASTAIENAHLYDGAQKAIRLRDEFLSIASHELRTPITPLKLHLQTLRNLVSKKKLDSYSKEKLDQMFNIADRQMERFQKLIEELLEVSRISVGRLKLEKLRVDLSTIVQETVNQFSGAMKDANCPVEIEAASAIGNWDKLRIEQILINLLANAMKYAAGQPIKVTVEIAGKTARLKVKDRGPGISKSDQPRIFERFERVASPRNFPGFGLGLYITKQVVQAHGGTIHVESEPGQGATFIVDLPMEGP